MGEYGKFAVAHDIIINWYFKNYGKIVNLFEYDGKG